MQNETLARQRFLDMPVTPGVTVRQLQQAFNEVAQPGDWKGPIRATKLFKTATEAQQRGQQYADAIEYFTATQAKLKIQPHGGYGVRLEIEAEGYRAGPAGP